MVAIITDTNFTAEVIDSKTPVLVDFYADWCGPCQMLAPFLDELAKEKGDAVKVVKINIDDNPMTPSQYNIRSIPTVMVFKDGQVVATKMGSMPKSSLFQWVDEAMAKTAA